MYFWFWENRPYGVRPYVHLSLHVSRDEILHFKHPRVSAVNRIATWTNNNNEADSFFRLNFKVYIGVDDREKAGARDKKTKETNFVWRITWKFYCGCEKMRNARGHQGKKERQRKKVNRTTYNISFIKCVTRKFLEVSGSFTLSSCKTTAKKCTKEVCCTW